MAEISFHCLYCQFNSTDHKKYRQHVKSHFLFNRRGVKCRHFWRKQSKHFPEEPRLCNSCRLKYRKQLRFLNRKRL